MSYATQRNRSFDRSTGAINSDDSYIYGELPDVLVYKRQKPKERKKGGYKAWQERKKTGVILVSPYSSYGFSATVEPLRFDVTRAWKTYSSINSEEGSYVLDPIISAKELEQMIVQSGVDLTYDAGIRGDLVTAALAESKEAAVDLLTSLAEMPETVEMIVNILKGIRRPLHNAKKYMKQLRRQKAKAVDTATQTWLLYRYGIMPAVFTTQDALKAIKQEFVKYQTTRKRERSSDERSVHPFELHPRSSGWDAHLVVKGRYVISHDVEHRCWIKQCFNEDSLRRRFGINPALTAWELVPLSFVVDWFIQVGDFIQAVSPSLYSQRASTYSIRSTSTLRGVIDSVEDSWDARGTVDYTFKESHGQAEIHAEFWRYDRVIINPESHLTLPTGVNLNLKRTLDGFSLSWPGIKKSLQALLPERKRHG